MINRVRISKLVLMAILSTTLVVCGHAHGVIVEDLYSATVPVADQSERLRGQAIQQGLGQVLVKLSGSRAILSDPGVTDILKRAQKYVLEYGYADYVVDSPAILENMAQEHTTQQNTGDERRNIASEPSPLKVLKVKFEATAIKTVLRDLFLPLWPADRPFVLLWVVSQTSDGYQFIESEDNEHLLKSAEALLEQRGIPFKSPLYDLQDQMAITPTQAWQSGADALATVSSRYGVNNWLLIRSSGQRGGGFHAQWEMARHGETHSGMTSAQSASVAIESAIDEAVDQFSLAFTYRAGQPGESVQLVINDIANYSDFNALMTLLSGLEVVSSTKVKRIVKDQLYLDLMTEGDAQVLVRALEGHANFSRIVDMGDRGAGSLYRFQWRASGR